MGGDALKARLLAGAQEMGVALDGAQAEAMLRLASELREWNKRINLTAITGPADMVDKHLLDSLSVQPLLHGKRIADIGTGAGFPGLPLAIVNPRRSFTLIEATGKKCLFVRHSVELLGIGNVEVIQARAESWKPRALFDCVIARALGKLADFVRVAGHLCARDGRMLAMKGRHPTAEMHALPAGWRVLGLHDLRVPGLAAERCVVEIGRAG
ncbi:MAG TPA: 16S rRNA (guanine(527)-N(7))-methyltransferase RsmG [Steroidobacteraceae bacterium]|nr:16S rRNA (guanine(527)-N(7))-methyltransferase RsmG [Steroidobacteraceae bacterium]